jgi:hypothetical protein
MNSNSYSIPGGQLIHVTGRDRDLPHWYRVPSHPLVSEPRGREIWVRFQDLSQAQSIATYQCTQNMDDPYGPDEDMPSKGELSIYLVELTQSRYSGLLEVDTNVICFSRELGCDDPTKDFLVFLGLDGYVGSCC